MTISEFKIWLEGVMAFQDSNWKPTAKQWELIYQKIKELYDQPVHHQTQPQHNPRPLLEQQYQPQDQVVRIPQPVIPPLNHDPSLVAKLPAVPYVSAFE